MKPAILLVEDEVRLAQSLARYLEQMGLEVKLIHHGDEVIPWLSQNRVQLILLDINLPGKNGLQLCREIRSNSNIPVVMLTAKVEEVDRLLGLELGADDYICKPYSPREVSARVSAILRRVGSNHDHFGNGSGHWTLDNLRLQVTYQDETVDLTMIEFTLLQTLMSKPNTIFSRKDLMATIYHSDESVNQRTIDSHIKKLRKKLEALPESGYHLQSVYGVGYRYQL